MAEYYTLGASLPTLKSDDYKSLDYSSASFILELRDQATAADRRLIDLLLLQGDNKVLLSILEEKTPPLSDIPLVIGEERLRALIATLKDKESDGKVVKLGDKKVSTDEYPEYMVGFVREYLHDQEIDRPAEYFYEDILANEYFRYAQKKGDKFIRTWLSLERNASLVLAAITAKRFNLDARKIIIGESELVSLLRSGHWTEISFLEESEVVDAVMKISEEEHLAVREHKIDDFKWAFLDNLTFADTFSIDTMLAYFLRLQILERWAVLDKERGERVFRDIVDHLNKEGKEGLERYKEMSRKKNKGTL